MREAETSPARREDRNGEEAAGTGSPGSLGTAAFLDWHAANLLDNPLCVMICGNDKLLIFGPRKYLQLNFMFYLLCTFLPN